MRKSGFAALGLAALALTACGGEVLETRDLSTLPQNGFDGAYMSYFLPRGVVKFTLSYEPPNKDKTVGVFAFATDGAVVGVPDISQHYHAVYRHAGLSTDTVTIQTTPNGMLAKVSSTSKDQSIDALKQLGEVVKQAIELRSTIEAESGRKAFGGPEAPESECPKFITEFLVDVTTGKILVPKSNGKHEEFFKEGSNGEISTGDVIPKAGCHASFVAHLTGQTEESRLDAQVFPKQLSAASRQACAADGSQGLCFRIQGGFSLGITATLSDGGPPIEITRFVQGIAPLEAPVGVVHFNRRDFVENTTSVEFTNGALTKIELKDPSELLGFLSLPLEALKFVTILVKV